MLNMSEVRDRFSIVSLLNELKLEEMQRINRLPGSEVRYFKCPFHSCEAKPTMLDEWQQMGSVFQQFPMAVWADRSFSCSECKRGGDVTTLHKLINQTGNAGVSFFEMLIGQQFLPATLTSTSNEKIEDMLGQEKKTLEIGTMFINSPSQHQTISWAEFNASCEKMKLNQNLADFAFSKGWLVETQEGVFPLGTGQEFVKGMPTISFPKILLTERFQEFYGQSGILAAKYRLTKEAETIAEKKYGKKVKWVAPKTFLQSIPWEFDAHNAADILFLVIGPGSGLRLYNELNQQKNVHEVLGLRTHVVGLDSMWNLSPTALTRDMIGDDLISVYAGFKKINILLDTQVTPLQENMLGQSLKLIKKFASEGCSVRQVRLNAAGVGEFFERGGSLNALSELCKYAAEV